MSSNLRQYVNDIVLDKLLGIVVMLMEARCDHNQDRKEKALKIVQDDLVFLIKILEDKASE